MHLHQPQGILASTESLARDIVMSTKHPSLYYVFIHFTTQVASAPFAAVGRCGIWNGVGVVVKVGNDLRVGGRYGLHVRRCYC